jgi:hypothetical protein
MGTADGATSPASLPTRGCGPPLHFARARRTDEAVKKILWSAVLLCGAAACQLRPAGCLIGNTVFPGGALNPADGCQSCQPALDLSGWSSVIGATCDGGPTYDGGADAGPGAGPAACADAATAAACTGASNTLNQCCNLTGTGAELCNIFVDAGQSALMECSAFQATDCATLHSDFLNTSSPFCCCPANQFCDSQTNGGDCVQECTQASDCQSGACAPATDTSQIPGAGFPYICRPNDGSPYSGCSGQATCQASYCCVTDLNGNAFCALPCIDSSSCGNGTCEAYDFSQSGCSGAMACGP